MKHNQKKTITCKMLRLTRRFRYQVFCKFLQRSPKNLLPILYMLIIILSKNQNSHQTTTPVNSSSQSDTRFTPISDKAYSLLLSTSRQHHQSAQQPCPEDLVDASVSSSTAASRRILQDITNHQMEDGLENHNQHERASNNNRTYFRPPSASESIVEPVSSPLISSFLSRLKPSKVKAEPEIQVSAQEAAPSPYKDLSNSTRPESSADADNYYIKPPEEYVNNNWLYEGEAKAQRPVSTRPDEVMSAAAARSLSNYLSLSQQHFQKNQTNPVEAAATASPVEKAHKPQESDKIAANAEPVNKYQQASIDAEKNKGTGDRPTRPPPVLAALLNSAQKPLQVNKGKYIQLSGLLPFARLRKQQHQQQGTKGPFYEDLQTSAQTSDISLGSRDVVMTPQMMQQLSQGMMSSQGSFPGGILNTQHGMKLSPSTIYQHYQMLNSPNKGIMRNQLDTIDPSASAFHQMAASKKGYLPRYESINAQLPSAQQAVLNTRNTIDIGDVPSTASFTLLPSSDGTTESMSMSDGGSLSGMDQDPMSILRALGGVQPAPEVPNQDSNQNEALAAMFESLLKNSLNGGGGGASGGGAGGGGNSAGNSNNNNNNNQKATDNQQNQQSNNNNNNNGNSNNANGNNQQQQPVLPTQQPQQQSQSTQSTQQPATQLVPPQLVGQSLSLGTPGASMHLNPSKALAIGQQPGFPAQHPQSMMMPSNEDAQQMYGSANPSEISPEYYPYGPQPKKKKNKGKKRKGSKNPPQIRVQKKPRVATGNPGFYDIDSQGDLQPSATFHRLKYPWLYAPPGAFRPNADDDEEEEGETEVNIRFFNNFSRMGPFGQLSRAGGTATLIVSLAFLIISNISLAVTVIAHGISSFLRNASPPERNKTTSRKRETTATPLQAKQRALDIFIEKTPSSTTISPHINSTSLEERIKSIGKIWRNEP